VLVTRPGGEVFVQRRAEHKDCAPGLWDTSAAGHVARGDSYDAAAPRELEEELGLSGQTLVALGRLPAGAATGNEFVRVYHYVTEADPRPDAGEIADSGWFGPAALAAWMRREPQRFTAVFRTIFRRYADGAGR
jgi:8-oxo-dGTP pyrophosphatase MutT (NUDIX family)